MSPRVSPFPPSRRRGSVLIIVIWVCLGLVALTVYFADQMTVEMRAADGQVAEVVARQAAAGGARYAAFVLGQFGTGGAVPYRDDYRSAEVALGDATFWLLGRDPDQRPTDEPVFGLVDEASKLNLNTATRTMLEALPTMTPELVDAILQELRTKPEILVTVWADPAYGKKAIISLGKASVPLRKMANSEF